MTYIKVGNIENISDIQFNQHYILTGSINKRSWLWRMGGKFEKVNNDIIFKNDYNMVEKVIEDEISLTVLKISQ